MDIRLIILFLLLGSLAFAQQHQIRVNFNEAMDTSYLPTLEDITVFDNNMEEREVLAMAWTDTASLDILIDFMERKSTFVVRVENVKDTAGNFINENNSAWFYFDGFDLDEPKPYLITELGTYLITNLLRHRGGEWYLYNIWWTKDTLYIKGIDTVAFYKYPKVYNF